jgi:hypothetical protein
MQRIPSICTMIQSDDDRMECSRDYVELKEGDLGSAEDITSEDNCFSEWIQLTLVFIGKEKMKWGKVKVLHRFAADGRTF